MKVSVKRVMLGLVLLSVCFVRPINAQASVVVQASGDESGQTDYKAIMKALKEDGAVVLEDGSTYYLKTNLWVGSNQSITATGATIISNSGTFRNKPTKTNYKSVSNFTVNGGTWKSKNASFDGSLIQFSHSKNITIKNATIYSNYAGHGIELVACKNVKINNCTLKPLGKCAKDCVEEQIQIDIATPVTAPTVATYGKQFVKGQTCQNITITNCTVTGGRAICSNFAAKEKKYQGKFHKNIVIKNNKLTGVSSEGLALFNVLGATVENNVIVSKSKRTDTAYSVGCHIAMFGNIPTGTKTTVYKVNNNTIKGGRQGFYVYSHSSSKFGKVIVKKNKCYAKAGADKAIQVTYNSVKKISLSQNKIYKWK